MKYKVIVLDLDGTLMNSEKNLSEENRSTLIELQKQGTRVMLASGRPTYGIMPVAQKLELEKYNGYILAYNGCEVIECATMKTLHKNAVNKDFHKKIYDLTKAEGCTLLTYLDEVIVTENNEDKYVQYEANLNRMEVRKVENLLQTLVERDAEPCKLLAVGEPENIIKLQEKINAECGTQICAFRSEPFFLEIVPLNIDKGATLNKLFPMLGVTKEQTIGFGDGFNDITMIEAVGCGVAMSNAQQELKDIAQATTLSNDEDGVAHYIKQNLI
ncbi:MAG: Cof-type HAD-IIB family hydrolase [Rikenellaceae bacterium]